MKRIFLTLMLLVMVLFARAQNDAQYSQYMFNGIYINPAYAGYKEEFNIHSFYRTQWSQITGAPESMSLAVDASANNKNVGLAFQVSNDRVGAQSSLAAYGNYAYRLRVGSSENSRLAFGLGIGVAQLGIDGSKLNPEDQGDEYIPTNMQSVILPDARAGVYYSNNRFYAGFSVDNLIARLLDPNKGRNMLVPIPKPHLFLTAGMLLPLSEGMQLKPSFLLKDDMGGPTSLDINTLVLLHDRIWLGASYRTAVRLYDKSYLQSDLYKSNSMVGMIELFAGNQFRIGYAFDFSLAKLQSISGSSHELSIGFYFKRKNVRMLTPRYF
ncbi:PorP/SprF family type IX secretion system membrane protein [Pedobacter borealis]|uniref:PorP/SprF family type IX secretion system membrane protein n=1 Tax=Pedobacter borealis TaxID=475254 RepID=UPI0004933B83|nr:type IX secretion system membrane protein PorP/SprF [Pedobacter borealis]